MELRGEQITVAELLGDPGLGRCSSGDLAAR